MPRNTYEFAWSSPTLAGTGVGSILMDKLLHVARDRHIKTIYGLVLAQNRKMLTLRRSSVSTSRAATKTRHDPPAPLKSPPKPPASRSEKSRPPGGGSLARGPQPFTLASVASSLRRRPPLDSSPASMPWSSNARQPRPDSYVSKLLARGRTRSSRSSAKSVEVILAAKSGARGAVYELADLTFHSSSSWSQGIPRARRRRARAPLRTSEWREAARKLEARTRDAGCGMLGCWDAGCWDAGMLDAGMLDQDNRQPKAREELTPSDRSKS